MLKAAIRLEREGLSVSEACMVAGIGRSRLYGAIAAGILKARKHGKRTLILRSDLLEFLKALPSATE
jgi:excisionase family DNA binding protein